MRAMIKCRRPLSLLLLCMLLVGIFSVSAFASTDIVSAPDAENGIYYVDDAGVLSSSTRDYIDQCNATLTNACGGQIAVVTLEYLNDLDCEEYAYEVLNQWGVGDSTKNNGTAFVLVTMEKKCWITTGSGVEDVLSAGKLEQILEEECYDDLDAGNYDTAVYDTFRELYSWYCGYYELDSSTASGTGNTDYQQNYGNQQTAQQQSGGIFHRITSAIGGFISMIFGILVLVIIVIAVAGSSFCSPCFWCGGGPRRRGPRGPMGPRGPWGGFGGGPRGGGGFGGGFGGGPRGGGGFGGGFGGGHGGGFGGGFGGGGGHGGGAGRR